MDAFNEGSQHNFSLAVFEENVKVYIVIALSSVALVSLYKNFDIFNISVITEGFLLETQTSCFLSKGETTPLENGNSQKKFDIVMPPFQLRIF